MNLPSFKKKIRKTSSGFTLIELLVVIMTMALLFGFGYASYREFARRQQLEGVIRIFKSDLRLAQQLALTGKKEAECSTLEGYRVRRASAQSYEIGAICDGNETCSNTPSYCIKTVNIPSNITLSPFILVPPGPGGRFTFLVLTQGVDRAATITFTQSGTGYNKSVNITPSGEIY